jgi:hypothetical protein
MSILQQSYVVFAYSPELDLGPFKWPFVIICVALLLIILFLGIGMVDEGYDAFCNKRERKEAKKNKKRKF